MLQNTFLVSNENGNAEKILKIISRNGMTSILRILKRDPQRFSQLMFKTRLNPGVLNRHLKSLMHYEIIIKDEGVYLLTPKGEEIVRVLDDLLRFV